MIDNFSISVPVIGTSDVSTTVSYFEETLGFERQWSWGNPPVYVGVRAGRAMLYISSDPDLAAAIRDRKLAPDVFLWVNNIESVYAQHCRNGADIAEELAERPWGVRQYTVREPNGYSLKIAELRGSDGTLTTS